MQTFHIPRTESALGCCPSRSSVGVKPTPNRASTSKTAELAIPRPSTQLAHGKVHHQRARAIGFELPGSGADVSTKKRATDIIRGASGLLLYRSILSTKPVEAFLKLLRSLQIGNRDSILEAYGAFFLEVASTKSISWRDYILDQIVAGWAANPWVKAASRGEQAAHLQKAAESDLESLQAMALSNQELVDLMQGAVTELPPAWLEAALACGGVEAKDDDKGEDSKPNKPKLNTGGRFIQAPASNETIEALKQEILGQTSWSAAASKVFAHYTKYGYGLTGSSSLLLWSSGSLQAFPAYNRYIGMYSEPRRHLDAVELRKRMEENLENLLKGTDSRDMAASSGVTANAVHKLNLEWSINALWHKYRGEGLRTVMVTLPLGEDSDTLVVLRPLLKLLGSHPRIRFAVVLVYPDEDSYIVGTGMKSWVPQELRHCAPGNVEIVALDNFTTKDALMLTEEEEEDREDEATFSSLG